MSDARCVSCDAEFESRTSDDRNCPACTARLAAEGQQTLAERRKMWETAGFDAADAAKLADSAFMEVGDLAPWTSAGFDVDTAVRWSAVVDSDWDNPDRYEIGDHTNLTIREIAAWKDAGFLPRQVEGWMNVFYNPFEAAQWSRRGISVHDAAEMRAAGRTPESVQQERDAARRLERGPTRQQQPDLLLFVAERCAVTLGGSPADAARVAAGQSPTSRRVTHVDVAKAALGDDAVVRRAQSDGVAVAQAIVAVVSQHVTSGFAAAVMPATTAKLRWAEVQHLCGAGRRWSRDIEVSFLAGRVEALLEPHTGSRECMCSHCNR